MLFVDKYEKNTEIINSFTGSPSFERLKVVNRAAMWLQIYGPNFRWGQILCVIVPHDSTMR